MSGKRLGGDSPACYNPPGLPALEAAIPNPKVHQEGDVNVAELSRGLATLAWVGAIVVVVIAVVRASRGRPLKSAVGLVLGVLALAVVFTSVGAGLVFVQPEERGVVISAVTPEGYRQQALQPGLHWIVPFAESVVVYPISRQTYTMSIAPSEGAIQGDDSVTARTADGQEVFIDASVIFSVDPNKIIQVHIDWQNRYDRDLVRPVARGIIRDEASRYGVEDIVSQKRQELIDGIRSRLENRLEDNGLVLQEFVLRNITFTPEYAASVEQKQIAEQKAQEAKLTVEQKRQEAEQARQVAQGQADAAVISAQGRAQSRLIEADAEAQALTKIANALQANQNLITYEYVKNLSPNIQVMLVPSDNPFLLPLPTPTPVTGGTPEGTQ
jgi:regulator of protease activity HflC (stomatin/prohibitin superfamily)